MGHRGIPWAYMGVNGNFTVFHGNYKYLWALRRDQLDLGSGSQITSPEFLESE